MHVTCHLRKEHATISEYEFNQFFKYNSTFRNFMEIQLGNCTPQMQTEKLNMENSIVKSIQFLKKKKLLKKKKQRMKRDSTKSQKMSANHTCKFFESDSK